MVRGIEQYQDFKEKIGANMDLFRDDLIKEIEYFLENILVNIADSYPQAVATGGTPRMKDVITDLNRSDDRRNDFLYRNGIDIKDYLKLEIWSSSAKDPIMWSPSYEYIKNQDKEEGDYSVFIMRVINSLIEVSQEILPFTTHSSIKSCYQNNIKFCIALLVNHKYYFLLSLPFTLLTIILIRSNFFHQLKSYNNSIDIMAEIFRMVNFYGYSIQGNRNK